ncbi:unnamed protein product [Linum tenue]|uniref:Peroxidase n=3 Tax=Linum tenue TaxID=586396 RepID=A0AAV0QLM3_9ROSI|nr:unnamed protein product [Linum tenue]
MKGHRRALLDGMLFLLMIMLFVPVVHAAGSPPLRFGFYTRSCPGAESIVRRTVRRAVSHNPGIGAGLIRLHFHDCFVRGCDGSVLLKSLPGGPQAERDHPANNPGLRGFNVISKAKRRIERTCPNTVSCADILAFAARDSSQILGRINYPIPAGRRDGNVSSFNEVTQNLPSPRLSADQLIQNFARKGLSADEMVTLSGAHSIGRARCSSFSDRLYNFNGTQAQDPTLDRNYAASLRATCPVNGGSDPTVAMDPATPNRLDNRYYAELRAGRGLLTTDQTLAESPATRGYVDVNARSYGVAWAAKFGRAMVKMGSIDVLTGNQGEIRRSCSLVN